MVNRMRVLVVEDDARMAGLLKQFLSEEGHAVSVAADGKSGLSYALTGHYDLLILDGMLPEMDGFEVVKRLRAEKRQTPILMLTARDATHDIVKGLNLGADDYLTKPFSFEVLAARVNAVSRRGPIPQPVCYEVGNLRLDPTAHTASRTGTIIHLTKTEFSILEILMRNSGRVVTRDTLLEQVWHHDQGIESNTLDAFVRLLRVKVEAPGEARLIRTVRGIGYSIQGDE